VKKMDTEYLNIDKSVLAEVFTSTEVYDNLLSLTDFGSRFGGTVSEKQAVDYMLNKLSSYGLGNVHKEEFEYQGWIRGKSTMEVIEPRSLSIKCIALPYCPSTPAEGIERELISVGDGTPEEFERIGDKIPGKFVLVTSRTPTTSRWRSLHRMEKLGKAIHHGAEAFIFQNRNPGNLEITGGAGCNKVAEIPTLGISYEEGWKLKRLLKDGPVRLRICTEHQTPMLKSWNVMGDVLGREYKKEIIIVGAHFDGHDISLGAMDDASGACVVMEAARLLAHFKGKFKRTLRFVCFPLEEIGLIGSFAYAHQLHKDELDNTKFMINLDGAGRSGENPAIRAEGFPELIAFLQKITKDMKYELPITTGLGTHSDFFPFFLKGIPSVSLASASDIPSAVHFSHTAADTPDKLHLRPLREASMVVARFIFRVADAEEISVKRKSPDEVKSMIRVYGLEENIVATRMRTLDQLIDKGAFATPIKAKLGFLDKLRK